MVVFKVNKPRRFLALTLCGLMGLSGCLSLAPDDKIDPSQNLSRRDYLALRSASRSEAAKPPKPPKNEEDADKDKKKDATPPVESADLPPPVPDMPVLAAPRTKSTAKDKIVSLSVTDTVPLRDVLLELGRDAGANLELDPRISGGILFTAKDQPFHQVLRHICASAGLRYREKDGFIRIELDEPYHESYPLDYLSLSRSTTSEIGIATNVFDVDVTTSGSTTKSNSGGDNNSTSKIAAKGEANFWGELEKSLTQLLSATRPSRMPSAAKTEKQPGSFSLDRQAGIVTIYGTEAQQEAARTYLDKLRKKSSAQVLIEARIVEVSLDDEYKTGINWRTLFGGSINFAERFGTTGTAAPFTTASTATDGLFTASVKGKDIAAVLSLVETFGTTRVLSAPRITALNNQPAVLKVARNAVYFTTTAQYSNNVSSSGVIVSGTPVFTSTPHTVPVGLVMTVQPAIDQETGRVTMTLRPTISRVVDYVSDPSVTLNAAEAGISTSVNSQIPVLAVREMDSVIQLQSGEVAILGGLMQDGSTNSEQGVPPFDTLPAIGELAKARDNAGSTSELVILLRATILDSGATPDSADRQLYHHYNRDPRPLMGKPAPSETKDDKDDKGDKNEKP